MNREGFNMDLYIREAFDDFIGHYKHVFDFLLHCSAKGQLEMIHSAIATLKKELHFDLVELMRQENVTYTENSFIKERMDILVEEKAKKHLQNCELAMLVSSFVHVLANLN